MKYFHLVALIVALTGCASKPPPPSVAKVPPVVPSATSSVITKASATSPPAPVIKGISPANRAQLSVDANGFSLECETNIFSAASKSRGAKSFKGTTWAALAEKADLTVESYNEAYRQQLAAFAPYPDVVRQIKNVHMAELRCGHEAINRIGEYGDNPDTVLRQVIAGLDAANLALTTALDALPAISNSESKEIPTKFGNKLKENVTP